MNKLKDIITNRFGGDLYRDYKKYSFLKRNIQTDNILEHTILKKSYYLAIAFCFGNKMMDRKYKKRIYHILNELYTSKEDAGIFYFKGIELPKPKTEDDKISFATEFLDHFIYYVFNDIDLCDALTQYGPYEYGNVVIKKGEVYIDAGANIGINSAVASNKGAIVYAFEPNKYVIDNYLSITAKKNENINIIPFALSDKDEQLQFTAGGSILSGSLEKTGYGKIKNESCTVRAISLDSFTDKNNITNVGFIKADIEGAERYMLKGASCVLRDFAPKLSICNHHLPDDPEVIRDIIMTSNPNYIIEERFGLLYAYVPKNRL